MNLRETCDALHLQLRALVDVEIVSDRFTTLQSLLLSSLHWEGREGINSSTDALTTAVRIAQEMGLHRNNSSVTSGKHSTLPRRIWWCLFALDRFGAATEGTPCVINEGDCDTIALSPSDFDDEHKSVRELTMANVELAFIVQDAIRSLYSPYLSPESLHTRFGATHRERITSDLVRFEGRCTTQFSAIFGQDRDSYDKWRTIFLVQ